MAISKNETGVLIILAAIAVILGYTAYLNVDVQMYPSAEVSLGGGMNAPTYLAPHEYVSAGNSLENVVNLPHRYPTVTGGNVTALIHRGFAPLRKKAPHDSRWIEQPPAEVQF